MSIEQERAERPVPSDYAWPAHKKYSRRARKMTWPVREDFQPVTADANGGGHSRLARIRLVRDMQSELP